MKKSQVSIELITLIVVLVIFYIIINIFSQNKKIDLINTEVYLDKRNECLRLSNIISSVYSSGHGIIITLKTNYLLTTYNTNYISIKEIDREGNEEICLIQAKISSVGEFSGDIKIKNLNGVVFIENA